MPEKLTALSCSISDEEIRTSKRLIFTEEYNTGEEVSFDRQRQYMLSDVDILINRMRGHNLNYAGNSLSCSENLLSSESFIESINASTFNSLIRLCLTNKSLPFNDIMEMALNPLTGFPAGLPTQNCKSVVIGLFSSTNMKRKMKKGIFSYDSANDSGGGHFMLVQLHVDSSKVEIFDSLNYDLRQSPYFFFPIIHRILQGLHDFLKVKRNQPTATIQYIHQKIKQQSNVDCGVHTLINFELLLRRKNPAIQNFDQKLIRTIRRYHYLLKKEVINEFRLELQSDMI